MNGWQQRSWWYSLALLCLLVVVFMLLPSTDGYPWDRTGLANELKEISMQWEKALKEAETALNDLTRDLELSETALQSSKTELKGLRAELQSLRLEVVRLKRASAESEMQRAELERRLTLVTQRIGDLRSSFEDYRQKVARESRRKKLWRTTAIIEFLALAGAVLFAAVK